MDIVANAVQGVSTGRWETVYTEHKIQFPALCSFCFKLGWKGIAAMASTVKLIQRLDDSETLTLIESRIEITSKEYDGWVDWIMFHWGKLTGPGAEALVIGISDNCGLISRCQLQLFVMFSNCINDPPGQTRL